MAAGAVGVGRFVFHISCGGTRDGVAAVFLLYALAFAITMGISVPLNEELAAAGDPGAISDPGTVRAAYEDVWVSWNLVRTLALTVALARLVRVLIVHARLAGRA
ncbi:anthrone oxygenase family protein [Actinoplanes xinjiangensis]|uniref:anthrone oxygenase family protein n=1 Tax=Actinoplanes xinjiangensis TaxID=512350 RepID=UPI00343E5E8E